MPENQPPILRTENQAQETPRYVTCDNCKCGLTIPANGEPGGQVFKMSTEAVEMRDYREKTQKEIQRKDEEITALNAKIVEQQGRIRELEPKEKPASKRLFQW